MIGEVTRGAPGRAVAAMAALLLVAFALACAFAPPAHAAEPTTTTESRLVTALGGRSVMINKNKTKLYDRVNTVVQVDEGKGFRFSIDDSKPTTEYKAVVSYVGGSGENPKTVTGSLDNPLVSIRFKDAVVFDDGTTADLLLKMTSVTMVNEMYDSLYPSGGKVDLVANCVDQEGGVEFQAHDGPDGAVGARQQWRLQVDTSRSLVDARFKVFFLDVDQHFGEIPEGIRVKCSQVDKVTLNPDWQDYLSKEYRSSDDTVLYYSSGDSTGVSEGGDKWQEIWPSGVVFDVHDKTLDFTWQGHDCGTDLGLSLDEDSVIYAPQVTKKVVGLDLEKDAFRFKLSTDRDGHDVVDVATNDASGNVTFSQRTFMTTGTHKFYVHEVKGNDANITYDDHVATLTINVTKDGDKLKANGSWDNATFTNVKNVAPPPPATKKHDKEYAEVGERITYTVTQTAHDGYVYESLVMTDPLHDIVTYDSGSFKVRDKNGRDVTASAGTLTVVSENVTVNDESGKKLYDSSKSLRYTFKKNWLANNADAAEKLTFTFTGTVPESAAGKTIHDRANTYTNGSLLQWTPPVHTVVPVWYVDILKKAEYPDLLVDNDAYSVAGAKFSVVDGQGVREDVTSDKDGKTDTVTVYHSGTVTATETTPPAGHKLPDPASKTAKLTKDNSGQTFSFEFVDPPYVLDVPTIARKVDADRYQMYFGGDIEKAREPQGDARDFSGFKVRVDFYAGDKPTGKKLASAVFASDKTGAVAFGSAQPVDGTTWRYVYKGKNVLPLGCVTVTEVEAPAGYDVSKDTYVATVVIDGDKAVLVPGKNWRHDG